MKKFWIVYTLLILVAWSLVGLTVYWAMTWSHPVWWIVPYGVLVSCIGTTLYVKEIKAQRKERT